MAKDKIAYVCSECGQESAKWIGKCPNCHKWNTFKEIRISADTGTTAAKSAAQTLNAHRSVGEGHSHADDVQQAACLIMPQSVYEVVK